MGTSEFARLGHRCPYNRAWISSRWRKLSSARGEAGEERKKRGEREGKEKEKEQNREGRTKGRKVPCPGGKRRTGIKKALVAIARTLPFRRLDSYGGVRINRPFSRNDEPFLRATSRLPTPIYKHNVEKMVRKTRRGTESPGGGGAAISNIQCE